MKHAYIAICVIMFCGMIGMILEEREETRRMEITNQIPFPKDSLIVIDNKTYKLVPQ